MKIIINNFNFKNRNYKNFFTPFNNNIFIKLDLNYFLIIIYFNNNKHFILE